MNTKKNLVKLTEFIHELAFESYQELGPGFKEDTFQKALAISFRHTGVQYLKETNIEVFFKKESLGVFRLDFVILPQKIGNWRLSDSVIIETKVASGIKNDARLQLKNYLLSVPLNNASTLNKARDGIILNWRNNLDALDTLEDEHIDIELWSMSSANDMKLIHKNTEVED
jgi:GxxExxY protein